MPFGFDAGYRTREEFQEWYQKDPVNLQRAQLLKQGVQEENVIRIEREIDNQIENSWKLAKEAPFADVSELHRNVFA